MLSSFVQFNRHDSEMNRLLSLSARASARPTPGPRFTVTQTADAWLVQGLLPGWSPEQLVVEVQDRILTLTGSEKHAAPEGFVPLRREGLPRAFTRTLRIPEDVAQSDISATAQHGVLTVTLPRRPKAEPRRIEVQAA